MRPVVPARLQLSTALSLADPAGLARGAGACRDAADELARRAGEVRALSGVANGGGWKGGGSAAFLHAAAEQTHRLTVAAELVGQFAGAQAVLATQLAGARGDALAAVERGRHLDAAAEQHNARAGLAPFLPSDPDAAQLQREIGDVTAELARAEGRARQAWRSAGAAFDVVGHGAPAMRARMTAGQWDPATHVTRLPTAATTCGVMDELALPAGGLLLGPDGRAYPLLVQTARGADGRLLVSTLDQPGDLVGWNELAVRYGRTAYGQKARGWERWAVALGAAAGAQYPMQSAFAPQLLDRLRLSAGGGAYFPEGPPEGEGREGELAAEPLRGKKVTDYWVAPTSGLASGRLASTPDGVGLLNGAIGGYLASTHLDDARAAEYRVVFEESPTGELRARMQLFRVLTSSDRAPSTVAEGGYVDRRGHLAGIPVTGEDPRRHASLRPAGN